MATPTPDAAESKPAPDAETKTEGESSGTKPNGGAARVDPKAYYGYLFEQDKSPTRVFDALLRAIGKYIVCDLHPGLPVLY